MLSQEKMREFRSITSTAVTASRQTPEGEYNAEEKKKSGLTRFADAVAGPFEAVSNALITPVVGTLARPFGETVASGAELLGKEAPAWTRANRLASPEQLAAEKHGITPQAMEAAMELRERGYKGAGFTDVMNALSLIPGVGLAAKGAETAVAGATIAGGSRFLKGAATAVRAAVPTGAKFGAGYGLAGALDEGASAGETAVRTVLGGAAGAATAAGLAIGVSGLGLAVKRVSELVSKDVRTKNIYKDNLATLNSIEDGNVTFRKAVARTKERGIPAKEILAQTDLLNGAVDNTGTIRTTQDGGAVQQMQDFIAPQEKIISRTLAAEGRSVPLEAVERKMIDNVNASGVRGADKKSALSRVEQEIEGLRLDADEAGNVPLSVIQDAKTYKYANINYENPSSKNTDKLMARTFKEVVEENTKSVDAKGLNSELATFYAVLGLVEKLDGKKVSGGRLGKYFAQTIGSIVGSHFGPLGAIVGAEIGGGIKGSIMSSTFGKASGKVLEQSAAMKKAIQQVPKGEAPRGGPKVPASDSLKDATATIKTNLDAAYSMAPAAKQHIDAMADITASKFGGKSIKAPLKGRPRAYEKVVTDYGGDVSQLTDIARNTVGFSDQATSRKAFDSLSSDPSVAKAKYVGLGDDEMGYIGGNVKVRAPNGHVAEMQVNSEKMLYAKSEPKDFVSQFGKEAYDAIKKETGLEGGLGHSLYEEFRSAGKTEAQKLDLIRRSNEYYSHFY